MCYTCFCQTQALTLPGSSSKQNKKVLRKAAMDPKRTSERAAAGRWPKATGVSSCSSFWGLCKTENAFSYQDVQLPLWDKKGGSFSDSKTPRSGAFEALNLLLNTFCFFVLRPSAALAECPASGTCRKHVSNKKKSKKTRGSQLETPRFFLISNKLAPSISATPIPKTARKIEIREPPVARCREHTRWGSSSSDLHARNET